MKIQSAMEAQSLRVRLADAVEEALSDCLTGLPNRRAFEQRCQALPGSATELSVALCDVDYFKSINDAHGHAVGDRILVAVAEILADICEGHMVARIGGEEFAVLFEGLTPTRRRGSSTAPGGSSPGSGSETAIPTRGWAA